MYALPHQLEFQTDDWLNEAARFVTETASRKELGAFSVSERWANPPPHLELGESAAWTLTFDGEKAVATRGFKADADQVSEGDYQAALTFAQSVGMLAPGRLDSALSEVRAWFGADALRTVRDSNDPGVAELLLLLHDHMGRRTVENPDLEHRAAAQGLGQHIRDMEENGYAVIENAITPEFADEVRDATLRALLPHQSVSMQWMLYHGIEFERLVMNPQLMTLIDASLGRGAVIASISSIKRGPGKGFIPMHADYSQVPEPFPEFSLTGVGVWALEDWTEQSGPTWLVPGSHRKRRQPKPGEKMEGIPIEMPKGSVVYFQHGVWHWQSDREEAGDRVTIHSHFNRGILRSLEPKKVDVQMLHRNSPRLGEALGEDDWFDKMTAEGRDHLRMAHMAKLNRFTDEKKAAILAQ